MKEEDVLTDLEEEKRLLARKRQEIDEEEEELNRRILAAKHLKTTHPIAGASNIKLERHLKTEDIGKVVVEGEKVYIDLT